MNAIEAVDNHNLAEVLPLIGEYQAFYQVAHIDDARNQAFFSQFGQQHPQGCLFLYRDQGQVVGFATVYFSFSSTLVGKVGVLNDLYVRAGLRGRGIGRALIEHTWQYAQTQGAQRLQWVTAPTNHTAQRLYDGLPTRKSEWFFYTYQGE